jgi:predicted aspartyl protease
MRSLIPLSLLLTLFNVYPTGAITFPFKARLGPSSNRLHSRADISGQVIRNTSIPIANSHNVEYISNITLGGQTIPVMLDTGSSDLWVTGNRIQATDTGKSATLSYAVGQAKGMFRLHVSPRFS